MKKRIIATVISAIMLVSVTAQAYEIKGYDTTKRSVAEAADEMGMSFEEYKEYTLINKDTQGWESEHEAELKTKVMPVIELMNMTVDEFKEDCGLTLDITEDTTMCEVYDNMPLSHYWDDYYAEEVELYGLTDRVTPETLYGEVRLEVEKQQMDAVERVTFSDVGYAHWAHYYITQMQKIEVIDGYNDGTYLPEKTVTRAEFAKIFAVATGMNTEEYENKYSDVSEDIWYAPYVNAVSEYIDAENGEFMPELPATREVVATAISKYLGTSDEVSSELLKEKFTDADTVSEKNAVYVADAVTKGIIDGFDDDTIRGGDSLTRAQAATVVYRALNEYVQIPKAYYTVVAKVGDFEITLGDAVYTIGLGTDVDLNDQSVLTTQIKAAVNGTANYFRYTALAKAEGITFTDTDRRKIIGYRAQYTSVLGYRKYCEYLNSYGTDIEYLNSYMEMLAYAEKLLEKYSEEEIEKKAETVEVKIYNDIIEKITLSDISMG